VARRSPAAKLAHILRVIRAWENSARDSSFFGMTLEQFKAAVRPSIELHARIANLQESLRMAIKQRNVADAKSMELCMNVGFAVKGNRRYGADSVLIAEMGYVRPGARRKRRRKR
jgi:hypothetical protein